MSQLSPESRALLEAARHGDNPSRRDRERVRRGVAVRVGATGIAGAIISFVEFAGAKVSAAGSAVSAAWSLGSVKLGLTAVLIGGAGAYASLSPQLAPTTPSRVAPQSVATPRVEPAKTRVEPAKRKAPDPIAAETPTEDPLETAKAVVVAHERRAEAPPGPAKRVKQAPVHHEPAENTRRTGRAKAVELETGDLRGELSILRDAHQALRKGHPADALALLEQHAAKYPKGTLSEERQAARAIALCRAGEQRRGRQLAQRFLAKSPKSPLAGGVRSACLSSE